MAKECAFSSIFDEIFRPFWIESTGTCVPAELLCADGISLMLIILRIPSYHGGLIPSSFDGSNEKRCQPG